MVLGSTLDWIAVNASSTIQPCLMKQSIRTFLFTVMLVCASARGQTPGDLFVSINNLGPGFGANGAIFEYTPGGIPNIFASGFQRPHGLMFDGSGNLFFTSTIINDPSGNFIGSVYKITPAGVLTTFATGFPGTLFVGSVKSDKDGNFFVLAFTNDTNFTSTIYKVPPGGTASPSPFGLQSDCIQSDGSNCSAPGIALDLAFDSAGNLFTFGGNTIYKFSPAGVRSVFVGPAAFSGPNQGPSGLAFDNAGNLYVTTEGNLGNDMILRFAPDGTKTTFATGLNNPRGIAFDYAGNLFVAEIPFSTTGDILKFTPGGGTPTVFASGLGRAAGNGGPEFLTFPPNTSTGSNVTSSVGTVGSATITLTFAQITTGGVTSAMPIDPASAGTLPGGYELSGANLAFDITTTATYTTPPPIIIAFQVPSVDAATFLQLRVLHNEGGTLVDRTATDPFAPNPTTQTIYASVLSLSPFVIAKFTLKAQVQQPINGDGTSSFSVKRGVVPIKFALTNSGNPTCTLPPATIALTRTAGGTTGAVNESVYSGSADTGSNFRIDSCQYVYNLSASALGVGTYRVDIKINGLVVGSAVFQLK